MKRYVLLILLVFLSGCRVGPCYSPPVTMVPEQWKNPTESSINNNPPICYWWEVFQDDRLNALEVQAIQNNPTLFSAMARYESAWAVAGISRADLYPQVELQPSYLSRGILNKIFLPSGVNIPGLKPNTVFRIHEMQYVLPLNMSYQFDFWGKYRQQYDSTAFQAQAEEAAYQVVLLNLTTDIATSYFNIQTLDLTADVLENIIKTRKKDYELNSSRYENGLSSYIDVSSALESLAVAENDYYDTLRQRGIQENILGALLGLPASNFKMEHLPLNNQPPEIPAGIPSQVLRQRPDIAEAERTMASEHAKIGVAYADLFPSFELNTAIGFLSPDFTHFLKWISRYWMIAIDASQTIFDAGRKFSVIEERWANFFQASGNFQQQVVTAFREVEDALNDLAWQKKQLNSLETAYFSAKKTTTLSKDRFKEGIGNYFEVVTFERDELNTSITYTRMKGQLFQSTIQLIKALGGSWPTNCCN